MWYNQKKVYIVLDIPWHACTLKKAILKVSSQFLYKLQAMLSHRIDPNVNMQRDRRKLKETRCSHSNQRHPAMCQQLRLRRGLKLSLCFLPPVSYYYPPGTLDSWIICIFGKENQFDQV